MLRRCRTLGTLVAALLPSFATAQLDILDLQTRICTDQNCDGLVNASDYTAWVQNYNNNNMLADQNRDGIVSPSDFSAWLMNYNAGMDGPYCLPYSCQSITPAPQFIVHGILPSTITTPVATSILQESMGAYSLASAGNVVDAYTLDSELLGSVIIEDRLVMGDDPSESPPADYVNILYSAC